MNYYLQLLSFYLLHEVSIALFCLFKGKSYRKYRKVTSNTLRLQNDIFLSGELSHRKLGDFPRLRGRIWAHWKLVWAVKDIPCPIAYNLEKERGGWGGGGESERRGEREGGDSFETFSKRTECEDKLILQPIVQCPERQNEGKIPSGGIKWVMLPRVANFKRMVTSTEPDVFSG